MAGWALVAALCVSTASDLLGVYDAVPPLECAALAAQLVAQRTVEKTTRWLPADADATTPMERAVAAIFAQHAKSRDFDATRSGSEYWVQAHVEQSASGALSPGIHLHRDFDLAAHESEGRTNSFPTISTITYLTTSLDMPTVIFASDFAERDRVADSIVHTAWLVRPMAGKHVAFNGSAWHGVAPPLIYSPGVSTPRAVGRPGESRVTLLVNIWLGNMPQGSRAAFAEERLRLASGFDAAAAAPPISVPPFALRPLAKSATARWERRVSASGFEWTRHGTPGGSDGVAQSGELALALLIDVRECTGVKLWLPSGVVADAGVVAQRGGEAGVGVAARLSFGADGMRLEFSKSLCAGMRVGGMERPEVGRGSGVRPEEKAAAVEGEGEGGGGGGDKGEGEGEAAFQAALALRATDGRASMRLLLQAASRDHLEAQAIVGLAYAQGQGGLTADGAAAIRWLRAAAARGHMEASYNLVALCSAKPACLEARSLGQAIEWLA